MVAIDPLLKQPRPATHHTSSHLTMRERSDPTQPRLIDKPNAISDREDIDTKTPFPKPPPSFFARRKHKIANIPRPTPSKKSKARRETVARK